MCEQSLVIGKGKGKDERRRVARVGSCFGKLPTINLYVFSLVKE